MSNINIAYNYHACQLCKISPIKTSAKLGQKSQSPVISPPQLALSMVFLRKFSLLGSSHKNLYIHKESLGHKISLSQTCLFQPSSYSYRLYLIVIIALPGSTCFTSSIVNVLSSWFVMITGVIILGACSFKYSKSIFING